MTLLSNRIGYGTHVLGAVVCVEQSVVVNVSGVEQLVAISSTVTCVRASDILDKHLVGRGELYRRTTCCCVKVGGDVAQCSLGRRI